LSNKSNGSVCGQPHREPASITYKEIEDVAEGAALSPEKLRVFAAGTGDTGKPLALNIENLAPETACHANFSDFALGVVAFGTFVLQLRHSCSFAMNTGFEASCASRWDCAG